MRRPAWIVEPALSHNAGRAAAPIRRIMRAVIFDLHTHTTASDGSLTPSELVNFAHERGVGVLAVTDHDTVAGCAEAADAASKDLSVICGIEFSTTWSGRSIHIVGLNVDPDSKALLDGVNEQQRARDSRAREIGRRLTRLGIDDPYPAARRMAGDAAIGRPHFAALLVDAGVVRDTATAFRKYLGAGKLGDVTLGWAGLEDVISWIHAAGGIAVIAHPAKYKMTMTKLKLLVADFVEAGGDAIEVVCGHQTPDVTRRLADVARDFELAASIGSDFHHPGQSWSHPGSCGQLPKDVRPVWESW